MPSVPLPPTPVSPLLTPTPDARATADAVARACGRSVHEVTLVLGSGWSEVVVGLADGMLPGVLP